jgi:hypothetical protein
MAAADEERWFEDAANITVEHQVAHVADAVAELDANRKEATTGRVIAALSFSFWTAMFSPTYEDLWRSTLKNIARREAKVASLMSRSASESPAFSSNFKFTKRSGERALQPV